MLEFLLGAMFFIALLVCVADDDNPSPFWALAWLGVFGFVGLWVTLGFAAMWGVALLWVATNPATILWSIAGYLVGAVVWQSIKWVLLNRTRLRVYNDNVAVWQKEFLAQDSKYSRIDNFKDFVANRYDTPPNLARHKYKIMSWGMWWPVNMITTIFNLKKLFEMIYRWMSNFWGQLQNMVFHNVDFSDPKKSVVSSANGASTSVGGTVASST